MVEAYIIRKSYNRPFHNGFKNEFYDFRGITENSKSFKKKDFFNFFFNISPLTITSFQSISLVVIS